MDHNIEVIHDLTMLYLKQLDLSQLSPAELYDKYQEAYREIKKRKSSENSASIR